MLRLSYAYKTSLLTRVPPRYLRFFVSSIFSEVFYYATLLSLAIMAQTHAAL